MNLRRLAHRRARLRSPPRARRVVGAPTPGPTIIPGPSGGGTLGPAELRLLLIDQLGPLLVLRPRRVPGRARDEQQARARAPGRRCRPRTSSSAAIAAAPRHRRRRRRHRRREARDLPPLEGRPSQSSSNSIGEDAYRFDYLAQPVGGAAEGTRTAGRRSATRARSRSSSRRPPASRCARSASRAGR